MSKCLVFPGQGSQTIGMGKCLYDNFSCAKTVFEEVDDAIGFSLSSLIFDGQQSVLNLTENAQPALMAVSMAVLKVLTTEFHVPVGKLATFVAGHSLGEYSALCANGTLDISTTAKILRARGKAMQEAVPVGLGGMVAILGLNLTSTQQIVEQASDHKNYCSIANDNMDGQIVISGYKEAVARASVLAREAGAKRTVPLPVSAPFHCALMQPAAEVMKEELQRVVFGQPVIPIITNVDARAISDVSSIRDNLVKQICARVRWRESMLFLQNNSINTVVEVGAGRVLCTMAKRMGFMQAVSINTAQDIEKSVEILYGSDKQNKDIKG